MAAINTDNLVGDFIINMKVLLEENRRTIGVKKVYDDDVAVIDIVPSIAIGISNVTIDRHSLGSVQARFEVDIAAELWYYHEIINKGTRRNQVMKSAWNVCNVIQQNATINTWLKSTRAYIRACTWTVRRNSDLLLASARISIVARYQTRFTVT